MPRFRCTYKSGTHLCSVSAVRIRVILTSALFYLYKYEWYSPLPRFSCTYKSGTHLCSVSAANIHMRVVLTSYPFQLYIEEWFRPLPRSTCTHKSCDNPCPVSAVHLRVVSTSAPFQWHTLECYHLFTSSLAYQLVEMIHLIALLGLPFILSCHLLQPLDDLLYEVINISLLSN